MSPVRVELWLIRILSGLPLCVSTMKGSKVVTATFKLLIVVNAALVPHQLFWTVAVVLSLLKLLPLAAVLPARRGNLILIGPADGKGRAFPVWIPPPRPALVLFLYSISL